MDPRCSLLKKIKQYDFTLKELNLYLDTYPNCTTALAMFGKYRKLREEAVADYNDRFGPLPPEQNRNLQN